MEVLTSTDCEGDKALTKFDDLYGTLKRLKKTEKHMKKLKSTIHVVEEILVKNPTSLSQVRDIEKPERRSSSTVVISKVSRKYALARRLSVEDVVTKKDVCPNWLLMLAEGYTALLQSFWEIREELKLICNKYMKQENTYSIICQRRLQIENDNFFLEIEKSKNILYDRYGGQHQTLTDQINEYKEQIQRSTLKKESLSSMCGQIHKEIWEMMNKYNNVYFALRTESDIQEGAAGRMRRWSNATMENEDNLKTLTCELDALTTNTAEMRTSVYFNVYEMTKCLYDLQYSYAQATEKKNDLESEFSTISEVVKQFSDIVDNLKTAKSKAIQNLCNREKRMSKLIEESNTSRIEYPKILDKKKRLQEEYQSTHRQWLEKKDKSKAELSLKTQELEKIKQTIFKAKKDAFVPLKLQRNQYREKLQKVTEECTILQEQYSSLQETGCDLREEDWEILHLKKKMKHLLLQMKREFLKMRQILKASSYNAKVCPISLLPKQICESSFYEKSFPLQIVRNCDNGQGQCENKHSEEEGNQCVHDDGLVSNDWIAATTQHLGQLRLHKSTLHEMISRRKTEILFLQEAQVLTGLACLSIASQLPKSSITRHDATAIVLKGLQAEGSEDMISSMITVDGTNIVLTDLLPSSKFSKAMFPMASETYVEIPARELCENFGKLLFL